MTPNKSSFTGRPNRPAALSKRDTASGSKAARLLIVGAGLLATSGGWAALAHVEVAGSAQPDVQAAASAAIDTTLPPFKTTTANLPALPEIPAVPTLVSPPAVASSDSGAVNSAATLEAVPIEGPVAQQNFVEPTPTLRAVALPTQPVRKPLATTRSSR